VFRRVPKARTIIIQNLLNYADLMELVESIAINGYLDLEPLFVVEEGARRSSSKAIDASLHCDY